MPHSHRSRRPWALGVALLALAGCATTPPSQSENACTLLAEKPDWDDATRAAERRWGTPPQVQLAIIRAESSFKHDAKPPRDTFIGIPMWWRVSSAYGYAQAKDETWDGYRQATGNGWASRTDFDDASDFIGWYTDQSQKKLGISKWDTYNQYLAYHEGQGGYSRGTYKTKDWLIRVARKVDGWAKTYGGQLRACRGRAADYGYFRGFRYRKDNKAPLHCRRRGLGRARPRGYHGPWCWNGRRHGQAARLRGATPRLDRGRYDVGRESPNRSCAQVQVHRCLS